MADGVTALGKCTTLGCHKKAVYKVCFRSIDLPTYAEYCHECYDIIHDSSVFVTVEDVNRSIRASEIHK